MDKRKLKSVDPILAQVGAKRTGKWKRTLLLRVERTSYDADGTWGETAVRMRVLDIQGYLYCRLDRPGRISTDSILAIFDEENDRGWTIILNEPI